MQNELDGVKRIGSIQAGALAAIRHLKQAGIRVMLGHSAADHDTTMAALAAAVSRGKKKVKHG